MFEVGPLEWKAKCTLITEVFVTHSFRRTSLQKRKTNDIQSEGPQGFKSVKNVYSLKFVCRIIS